MTNFLLATIKPQQVNNFWLIMTMDFNKLKHKIWYWCTNGSKSGLSTKATIIIIAIVIIVIFLLAFDSSHLLSRKTRRSQRENRQQIHSQINDVIYQEDDAYEDDTHVPYRNPVIEFLYQLFH